VSTPQAGLSWSHTRNRTFVECARRYYWRYLLPGHWLPDAPPIAREVHLLKQLTSLYGVLGIALHNIARDCVVHIKRGDAILPPDTIFQRARGELNRVCLSSEDRGGFLRYPATHPMLQDVWFFGARNPETDRRVRERLHTCTANLANHPMWDELRACEPSAIIAADSLSTFDLDEITVYAAPDLVYSPKADNIVIGDWKTGGTPEDDHMPQIATYALWVRDKLGVPWAEGQWQGRIMDLLAGEDHWYDLREEDLEAADRRIRMAVRMMQESSYGPDGTGTPSIENFPVLPPDRRAACQGCVFFSLCAAELRLVGSRFESSPACEATAS
jgi:hypothetical protein